MVWPAQALGPLAPDRRLAQAVAELSGAISSGRKVSSRSSHPFVSPVVLALDKLLENPDIARVVMEGLGYRQVRREPAMRAGLYAKPWPLWALLRGRGRLANWCWGILWWLSDRGVFHVPEGVQFMWRNVRLGRGRTP